MIVPPSAS